MRSFLRIGAAVALASAGAVTVIGSGTAGAEAVTQEFEFTGDAQEFVVPADVCSVTIDAFGAQGGSFLPEDPEVGGVGGEGGRATATIAVTPGEMLLVYVGGQGEDGSPTVLAADDGSDAGGDVSAAQTVGAEGGFNGGGDALLPDEFEGSVGGGGGGASDVRQGGSSFENRVVVAGGGGGGGTENDPPFGDGGDGGGPEGGDGQPSDDATNPTPPGLGGTQTAGGAAPTSFDPSATDGELGQGGIGGEGTSSNDGGGGGGGGYFGGGGGAGDSPNTDNGAGGGGGSGFGPAGTSFETGNQFGDGLVLITYDPAAQSCPVSPIVIEPTFTG